MRALILLLLAACQTGHEVKILLGPTESTLSVGFLCEDAAGRPLLQDALDNGMLRFTVVADIITIGDKILGCRGEELLTACEEAGAECVVLERKCHEVEVPFSPDSGEILEGVKEALADFELTKNAPDDPVVIRVMTAPVALAASCPDKDVDLSPMVYGCAHSCPVQLDTVDQVSLGLDALNKRCIGIMRICAAFPRL